MTFICISGKAQSGKDTTADYICTQLVGKFNKRVLKTHYADLLKYICKQYFNWNGIKDANGRTLLQKVGTDIIRAKYPDFWVDFILNIIEMFPNEWDFVVIPDTRFPNEVLKLKQKEYNVVHIKVDRNNFDNGLTEIQTNHISETALDGFEYDYILNNNSSYDNLYSQINPIINALIHKNS